MIKPIGVTPTYMPALKQAKKGSIMHLEGAEQDDISQYKAHLSQSYIATHKKTRSCRSHD